MPRGSGAAVGEALLALDYSEFGRKRMIGHAGANNIDCARRVSLAAAAVTG